MLAHGITVDREEGTVFTVLAERLAAAGIGSLRFDFRGHGDSGLEAVDMTIAGETLDLTAAVQQVRRDTPSRVGIVAASFGAASTAHLLAQDPTAADFVVLLNPLLDNRRTLLEPEMPWAQQWFTPDALWRVHETGRILIEDRFAVGAALIDELRETSDPQDLFQRYHRPLAVIHGTADTYVSCAISRAFAEAHPQATFIPIEGSEHGFHAAWATRAVCDEVVHWISAAGAGVDAHQ